MTSESDNDISNTDDNVHDLQNNNKTQRLQIEYCTGCRWLLRSAWLMQELLTTFETELDAVTLVPSKPPSPGGTFLVTLNNNDDILWDRKAESGFPEAKELKQRVRNKIAPKKDLGHSDDKNKESTTTSINEQINVVEDCVECEEAQSLKEAPSEKDQSTSNTIVKDSEILSQQLDGMNSPNVEITYCTGCRWLLRSAWMCQELLTTFQEELVSVTLIPSRPPSPGGQFTVSIDDKVIWDRSTEGRFPEMKELKQIVRDYVSPDRDLGHSDNRKSDQEESTSDEVEQEDDDDDGELDDDEAEELRRFYGVM